MVAWQWAILVVAATIACTMKSLPASADSVAAETVSGESWLAVSLNAQPAGDVALFIRQPDGCLLATSASLRSWRLPVPAKATVTHQGEAYFPLDALPGLSYRVDEEQQLLNIEAPAKLFDDVRFEAASTEYVPAPAPPPGGFLNYDIAVANADGVSTLGGLLEASVFGPAGAGVVRFLERHGSQQTQNIRLDSTWTRDRPESASSFRLGDSITGSSRWWGGAVRFGGIQLASNYATRPGLVTLPLPSVAGEAVVPSTFELYVNGALRMRNSVPGGPFSIDDVPVVTGQGQIRVVLRDVLGREQVITEPYYASPRLLRAGLHEYSIEAGVTRENFGIESYDYGRPLLVGTERTGLTNSLTAEVHGEVLRDQQTLGIAGALLFSGFGVLSASLAGSHGDGGNGRLLGLGLEHSAQRVSFGGTVEFASVAFTRLGVLPDEPVPYRRSQLYATTPLGWFGSVGISRTTEDFRNGRSVQILSARNSINIGRLGYLSLSALRIRAERTDTMIALNFTRSLNDRTSANANITSARNGTVEQLQVQRSLPAGKGMGYRMLAATGETSTADASLSLQSDFGTYELEAQQQAGATVARASASGGLAMLAGHVFPSRRIESSFAVAQVGEERGVRIYRENQLIGETNAKGYLLLPGLRAYQDNRIRVEQADLPLDVPIDAMEVQAVPWFRSGAILKFAVDRPRGALIAVLLENGEPLPAGALVQAKGQQEQFPSGLRGEVYMTGLAADNSIRAEWNGHSCEFRTTYAQTNDPLPRLGPFVCKSSSP